MVLRNIQCTTFFTTFFYINIEKHQHFSLHQRYLLSKCTLNRGNSACNNSTGLRFSLGCNMGNYLVRKPVRYDSHSRSRESNRTDPLTKWPRLSRRPEMVVQWRYTESKSVEMYILIFHVIMCSDSLFFCREEDIAMHQQ